MPGNWPPSHFLLATFLHLAVSELAPPQLAERRVFMWIWGNETQVLADAALAASHNTSITDVPLGCGPKGGFQMSRPFNASWLATCTEASKTLRAAGLRPWISLEPVVDSNMTANRAFWLNPPLEQMREALELVGAVGWNFDWECNGTPQDEDAYLSFLTRARAALGAPTVVDANGNGCIKDYGKLAKAADFVMDMSLYYEQWPADWTKELDECLASAGKVGCMVGMADYKKWSEDEVKAKLALVVARNMSTLGVFTLAERASIPEPFWWPILEGYLRGA